MTNDEDDVLKLCKQCKKLHSLSNFYRNAVTNDGYDIYCKPCKKQKVKWWDQTIARPPLLYCLPLPKKIPPRYVEAVEHLRAGKTLVEAAAASGIGEPGLERALWRARRLEGLSWKRTGYKQVKSPRRIK